MRNMYFLQEGTMYMLWARGNATFDLGIKPNRLTVTKEHNNHREVGKTEGLHKLQLLRADKIEIMEK